MENRKQKTENRRQDKEYRKRMQKKNTEKKRRKSIEKKEAFFLFSIFYFLFPIFLGCGPNYLKNGLKYLDESNYNKAEIEFKKAILKEPKEAKGYVNLGIIYIKQGRISEAISMFETAVEVDQSSAEAYNDLAFAYAEKNMKLDSALYLAKNAAKLRPTEPKILDTLAWIYYKKGMYQEALEAVNDAITADPSNQLFQEHLKVISEKINQLQEVWIQLGTENVEGGVKLLDVEPDGKTTSDSNEGIECRRTDVKNHQNAFYFALDEPITKKVEEMHIKVEYLSKSANPILIYLSSKNKNEFDKKAVQVDINKIGKLDEIDWREASFTLTETAFSTDSTDSIDSIDSIDPIDSIESADSYHQPIFKIVNTSSEEDICIRFVSAIWIEGT